MERSYGYLSNTEPVLNTLLLTKGEAKTPDFDATTEAVLGSLLLTKSEAKTPEFDANTEPVLRTLLMTKNCLLKIFRHKLTPNSIS